MALSEKGLLALTRFADNLRGRGQHDIADELEELAEKEADKGQAPKKKKL